MLKKIRKTSAIIVLLLLCIFSTILLDFLLDQFEFPKLRAPKPLPGGLWLYPSETSLLNLPHFKYLINNDVCVSDSSIFAVILITSHAGDTEGRAARRRALPSHELKRLKLRQVFLLATATKNQTGYKYITQDKIVQENIEFGDIIQGNFEEAYRNLTYKHVMGLNWAINYCNFVKFIIKLDDDIAVNIYKLIAILRRNSLKNSMLGYVLNGMKPDRGNSKWKVSVNEWPNEFYPKFLSGWLYVTTPNVATKLLDAVRDKFFWIDDVFVTGVATQMAKVALQDMSEHFVLHSERLQCCIQGDDCDFIVAPSSGDWGLLERYQSLMFTTQGVIRQHQHQCVVTGDPNSLPLGPGTGHLKPVSL